MATGRAGISGAAVAIAAAGGLLLWTGITNRAVRDAMRDMLQGRPPGSTGAPTGPSLAETSSPLDQDQVVKGVRRVPDRGDRPDAGTPAASGDVAVFVATVRAQLGKPYSWGAAGPDRFDCSGLITYGLKAAGLDNRRRVTSQYLVWDGAYRVARESCREGDLVCWSGHIGMATGRDSMIHAPSFGRPVQRGTIWSTPAPQIRRIGRREGPEAV